MTRFTKWLDTLIQEKNIDLHETFNIEAESGLNIFEYGAIVDAIKTAPTHEQKGIKNQLVKIDFMNGDIRHFFRHLAGALV